jgi:hypothetical protein
MIILVKRCFIGVMSTTCILQLPLRWRAGNAGRCPNLQLASMRTSPLCILAAAALPASACARVRSPLLQPSCTCTRSSGDSKRFLCSYIKTPRDIKNVPTNQIFKGKHSLIDTGDQVKESYVKKFSKKILQKLYDWLCQACS